LRIFCILSVFILIGCVDKSYKVEDFDSQDLKWYEPFEQKDTVIFVSEKMDIDTIIFGPKIFKSDSTRNYKQGFSNTNYLVVPYSFSPNSYHQFSLMGDGKTRYSGNILRMDKSSNGHSYLEFTFIGMFHNSRTINKVNMNSDSVYHFKSNDAQYKKINVEKGINSFNYDTNIGVVDYIDNRNVYWKRK